MHAANINIYLYMKKNLRTTYLDDKKMSQQKLQRTTAFIFKVIFRSDDKF